MSKCECPNGLIGRSCNHLAMAKTGFDLVGNSMACGANAGVCLGIGLFCSWFIFFMLAICIFKVRDMNLRTLSTVRI